MPSISLLYFTKFRSIISEAFDEIEWETYPWGSIFSWPDFYQMDANFAYYKLKEINPKFMKEIKSWVDENPSRKLIADSELKMEELTDSDEFSLMWRPAKKYDYPLMHNQFINRYSYKTKDPSLNIRDLVTQISEILEVPSDHMREFNRYTQAILHLWDGTLWTNEDEEGNVYSIAITTELDQIDDAFHSIEFIATRKKLKNQGYAKLLIGAIISKINKPLLLRTTKASEPFFEKFDFVKIHSFKVWRNAP